MVDVDDDDDEAGSSRSSSKKEDKARAAARDRKTSTGLNLTVADSYHADEDDSLKATISASTEL